MYLKIIFLLVLLVLLIFLYKIFFKKKNTDDEVCLNIYLKNDVKKFKVFKNIFTPEQCKQIIREGENYAEKYKWKTKRHERYPTTDNEITKKWKVWSMAIDKVNNFIMPEIEKMWNLQKNKLTLNEMFIVKYDVNGQRKLKYHEDGSEFSFIITLNDSFTGGGTTFKHNKEKIETEIGSVLIFCGQNTHRGNYLNSGTRYILTGFISYIEEDYCGGRVEYLKSTM